MGLSFRFNQFANATNWRIHPVRGDIMDVGPSTAAGLSADLVSSNKGTRTRTVREYEQTISELKKENFDLKLKIYMYEEGKNKNSRKDKDSFPQDNDNAVQVIVQLKLETESLRSEMNQKDKLLLEERSQAEKYVLRIEELSKRCEELEKELLLLSRVPSQENSVKDIPSQEDVIQSLEKKLLENNEELEMANKRVEKLADEIRKLEEKKNKRTLAIQNLLIKEYQERELLPPEIKEIAIAAVQGAKSGKKEELVVALNSFKTVLCQELASSVPTHTFSENESFQHKCLEEESIRKRNLSLPSQNVASTDLSSFQVLEKPCDEPMPVISKTHELHCFIRNSHLKGTPLSENQVAEKDVDFMNFPNTSLVGTEKVRPYVPEIDSNKCHVEEHKSVDIENIFAPTTPPVTLHPDNSMLHDDVSVHDQNLKFDKILKENMELKELLEGKQAVIEDLKLAHESLKLQASEKDVREKDILKELSPSNAFCQTDISLSRLSEVVKLKKYGQLSEDVNELQEDILFLLLTIDERNKELSDMKQALSALQAEFNHNLTSNNQTYQNEEYTNEINELHERLAFSCSVNSELLKHLRNLEAFMEDLLQNKFDSSMESISGRSSFLSSVSRCLNESVKLSNALSGHLSICEGSKLFEECKSILCQNQSIETSFPTLDVSENSVSDHPAESNQGIQVGEPHFSGISKIVGNRDLGLFYENTLCKKCSQPLNSPQGVEQAHRGYPSSDSDIWSEPDRDISMQRIGINLQISPTSSKSPRKLRTRERRRLSFDHYTSSSDVLHNPRRKLNGAVCRRLLGKESNRQQSFFLDKYYFLLSEKYLRLKSLLNSSEVIKDEGLASDTSKKIDSVMTSLERTLQKLEVAKDNAKNFPTVACGKCAILELLLVLRPFTEFFSSTQSHAFQQFIEEISLLKEECDEIVPDLPREIAKVSRSVQSCLSNDQEKLNQLEQMIETLNDENGRLVKSLSEKKELLIKDETLLKSVQAENLRLSKETKHLKEVISDLRSKGNELTSQVADFNHQLSIISKEKSDLSDILESLEQTKRDSDSKLDQLATDLQKNKSELVNMSIKCMELEKELSQKTKEKDEFAEKFKSLQASSSEEIEKYVNEIENLNMNKRNSEIMLENSEMKVCALEKEISLLNADLNAKDDKLKSLLSELESLQNSKEAIFAKFTELNSVFENSSKQCSELWVKCKSYEKEASQRIKSHEEQLRKVEEIFSVEKRELLNNVALLTSEKDSAVQDLLLKNEQLKQLMAGHCELKNKLVESCEEVAILKSLKERLENESIDVLEKENIRLLNKIATLTSEKNCTIQDLQSKNEQLKKLISENQELNKKLVESYKEIDLLKSSKKELENDGISVMLEKENIQSTLLSTDSKCGVLGKDLEQMQELLKSSESKCLNYENQLMASSDIKEILVDCIYNVMDDLINTRRKLVEMGKACGVNLSEICDNMLDPKLVKALNEHNVGEISCNVISQSRKLSKTVDDVLEALKQLSIKSKEIQLVQEKYAIQLSSIRKQTELQKREMDHLQSQNDLFRRVIDDKQKTAAENQKSEQLSAVEIQTLKEKVNNFENDIERKNQLLKTKDDEITVLQEKLFNSQTFINTLLAEKNKINSQLLNESVKSDGKKSIESYLHNSLSPQVGKNEKISNDSVHESEEQDDIRLEQLENEIDDSSASASSHKSSCCEKYSKKCHSLHKKIALYRKRIQILEEEKARLREFHTSNSSLDEEIKVPVDSVKVSELESKLEQKKNFIAELKAELLKACNSLIDKEREVDILKGKLAKNEAKFKLTDPILCKEFSPDCPKTVDSNIKNLTNYKWSLIKKIFDIERNFYVEKGIHLNHFDQFKDHVSKLYALQLAHTLSKSTSLPLINSSAGEHCFDPSDYRFKHLLGLELDIECLENLKIFLSRFFVPSVIPTRAATQPMQTQTGETPKIKLSLLKPSIAALPKDCKLSDMEKLMWNISQHIDIMTDFFDAVKECEKFSNMDVSSSVTEEMNSLLLNVISEARKMHEVVKPLFKLNVSIKELEFFSRRRSKPDVSDQESVLSEETITLSRSDTPVSGDELKLDYSLSLKLNLQTMMQETLENRAIMSSGKPCQIKATLSSSCDSVHHRSQYSSPDLGIESDPNHESSIPEQKDKEISTYQKSILDDEFMKENTFKSPNMFKGSPFVGDQLHSVCNLSQYELLKREIQECLVGIKSVLSRTGDGLHQIAKYTSPRKTLEYSSLKAIKDTCANIEVCLKKANALVRNFWISHCPSEHEWNALVEENQRLCKQLSTFKDLMQNQKFEFKQAMGKLEDAQVLKANMERKISKKLVKTKKVIRKVELKLLENQCQNCPPVPKYPLDPSLRQDLGASSSVPNY